MEMEMDGVGDEGVAVAPGFRFYPTEEELVSFYLNNKIKGNTIRHIDHVIPQLHVYDFDPWDLPAYAGEFCRGEAEQWFFYNINPRQNKEGSGRRLSRLTDSGYWKSTGSLSVVYSSGNQIIGMKKTLVFYCGRAPTAKKTKWKMNEYNVFKDGPPNRSTDGLKSQLMQEFSLCRIYVQSKCIRSFDRRPPGVV